VEVEGIVKKHGGASSRFCPTRRSHSHPRQTDGATREGKGREPPSSPVYLGVEQGRTISPSFPLLPEGAGGWPPTLPLSTLHPPPLARVRPPFVAAARRRSPLSVSPQWHFWILSESSRRYASHRDGPPIGGKSGSGRRALQEVSATPC